MKLDAHAADIIRITALMREVETQGRFTHDNKSWSKPNIRPMK